MGDTFFQPYSAGLSAISAKTPPGDTRGTQWGTRPARIAPEPRPTADPARDGASAAEGSTGILRPRGRGQSAKRAHARATPPRSVHLVRVPHARRTAPPLCAYRRARNRPPAHVPDARAKDRPGHGDKQRGNSGGAGAISIYIFATSPHWARPRDRPGGPVRGAESTTPGVFFIFVLREK